MWSMIWPLLLIVLSNCFYNICTKSVQEGANAFGTLTITYLVGAVLNKWKVMHDIIGSSTGKPSVNEDLDPCMK